MKKTTAQQRRDFYFNERKSGKSREQVINSVPAHIREQFIQDIDQTFAEAHFGIPDKIFYTIIVATMIVTILTIIVLIYSFIK